MYNDFPILKDEEYFLLQTHYKPFSPWNREENVYKIFLFLNQSTRMCYSIEKNFNNTINTSLNHSKLNIEKILDNLTTIFNFKISNKDIPASFNVFTLTTKLIECAKLFASWCQHEQKEYYKKIAYTCACDLLNSVKEILLAMEKS